MNSVTKQEMIELDARMINQYKIPLEKMMERAGKVLANLVDDLYPKAKRIVVLAGTGNNGGGGLVAARYLAESGKEVRVVLSRSEFFLKPVPKKQLDVLPESVMVGISEEADGKDIALLLQQSDIVIDALLGYSIAGAAQNEIKRLIEIANEEDTPVVALDIPSGFDPDEGPVLSPHITARVTLGIALPKEGLLYEDAQEHIGKLYIADIGVPDVWFREHEYKRPLYSERGYVFVPLVYDDEVA